MRGASWIIGLALLGGAFLAGYWVADNRQKRAALETTVRTQVATLREIERSQAIAYEVGQKLAQERISRANDRKSWERKLRNAENKPGGIQVAECPSTPSNDVGRNSGPGWLSPQFVGLLNQSLCRGEACDRPGTDGGAGETIGVQAGNFLIQADQNHERWAVCRDRLRGWQDLARKNGWVK